MCNGEDGMNSKGGPFGNWPKLKFMSQESYVCLHTKLWLKVHALAANMTAI
jgi:hypothetical protein